MSIGSLRSAQKERFLSCLRAVIPENKWKVLVVDQKTRDILKQTIPENLILDENVTAIETLEQIRHPTPEFEAIYIIQPSQTSFQCIAKDFKYQLTYKKAHVRICGPWSQSMVDIIQNGNAGKFVVSVSICELNYIAREDRYFETGDQHSFLHLYNTECKDLCKPEINSIASKIISVLITLDEFPILRYYQDAKNDHVLYGLNAYLANCVKTELEHYKKSHPDKFKSTGRPRAILLIMDRSLDPKAPFLHEFTYQAMAYDLLEIRDHKYKHIVDTPKGPEHRLSTLSQDDELYIGIRHLHMKDAIDKLLKGFNEFCRKNEKFVSDEAVNLSDLKSMLANLSDFQEERDDFTLHLGIAQMCMSRFQDLNLELVAAIEQDLATGMTVEGGTPRNAFEDMVHLLESSETPQNIKVRLVALYVMYRSGLFAIDINRIRRHSKLSSREVEAIKNLQIYGVKVIKTLDDKIDKFPKTVRVDHESLDLSRYIPQVKQVLLDQISGQLDPNVWHYIGPENIEETKIQSQQSLRSARPTWARSNSNNRANLQRVICYMVGGVTMSEIRSGYEISRNSNYEVFIGSTNILTPNNYIELLKKVNEPRSVLNLPKDRLPEPVPLLVHRPIKPKKIEVQPIPSSKNQHVKIMEAKSGEKKKNKRFGIF